MSLPAQTLFSHHLKRIAPFIVVLSFFSLPTAATASGQNEGGGTAYQNTLVLPSRLQVTGTAEKISIDAERADVQSVLKAVLKQAGKQYLPDTSVTGQVTLLLNDQPLSIVLRSLCEQTYLRYTVSSEGIYRFHQDDEAIKNAFTRISTLNAGLRQQLRRMGLEVPPDTMLLKAEDESSRSSTPAATKRNFFRVLPDSDRQEDNAATGKSRMAVQTNGAPAVPAGSAGGAARNPAGPQSAKKDGSGSIENIHTDFMNQANIQPFLPQGMQFSTPQQYQSFLRRNNFVWFNIPEEKPQPVATVLQQFSQQANVQILLDQSIPNSLRFRVWGTLSPRQLPEALNVLAPTAHLQWRWVGNTIFVVPAPEIQVYLQDMPLQRNSTRGLGQQAKPGGQTDTGDKKN